ncbi:MAG TPA: hypothetical protein VNJ87_00090, partial [Candidatus Macondimonas sp.]|nr:hypothetical protein [Candidatus Macondimonas sp.]
MRCEPKRAAGDEAVGIDLGVEIATETLWVGNMTTGGSKRKARLNWAILDVGMRGILPLGIRGRGRAEVWPRGTAKPRPDCERGWS